VASVTKPTRLGLTQPTHDLPTGSLIFVGGAAAAAVAPSPPPSRPQPSLRFEVLCHPSASRRCALPSAAAAAPRGCAVASSSSPAPRRWRRPEGRGDGARPAPRRSRCGITPLLVPAAFGFVFVLVVLGKPRSRILPFWVLCSCRRWSLVTVKEREIIIQVIRE